MRATIQLEVLKGLLINQHGVPQSVVDQIDHIYRLTYQEGYGDGKRDTKEEIREQRFGEEGI